VVSQDGYKAGLTEAQVLERTGAGVVVKLNSNENPLGAPPAARIAMAQALAQAHRYPPAVPDELHRTLARKLGVDEGCVVSAPGSVALLERVLALTCGEGRGETLSFAPCFPAFAHRAGLLGVAHRQVPLAPDFRPDLAALARAVGPETRLVYLANPDNPSGHAVPAEALADLARALPSGALLLLDEAYVDFVDDPLAVSALPLTRDLPNIAVVRTLSKAWGLAGMRVGYGVFPPALARELRRFSLPFGVGGVALAGALTALRDEDFHRQSVDTVRRGRRQLLAGLPGLGCEVAGTQGAFVMFRPPRPAGEVFEKLLASGVVIRPLDYAGLPDWLRVSVGTQEENTVFLEALGEMLAD